MSKKYKFNKFNYGDTYDDDVSLKYLNHMGRGSMCDILGATNPPNFSGKRNCDRGVTQCNETKIFNHCIMHLEPRLQEYVKKRDYYKKNKVTPSVSLNKEFRMTRSDLKKVCDFDKCNKDQSKMDASMLDGFDHPSVMACTDNTFYGEDIAYTNTSDPKSQEYRNFDKFGRDLLDPKKCNNDWKGTPCHKPLKYINRKYYPNCGKSCKNGCKCSQLCDTGYSKQLGYINLDAIDQNTLLRCSGNTSRSGDSCAALMDSQLKVVIPNARARCTKDENINHSYYKAVPYMGQGSGRGDIDLNSVLKYGETERGSKQKKVGGITIDRFEQLPWDIQCVDHVVLPFPRGGYDTRLLDKYSRRNAHYVI